MCDTMINCLKGYGGHSQGWRPGYRMFSCSRNFKHFSCPWVSSTLSFLFTCGWQHCSLKYSMWWWPQLGVTPEAMSFWHQALIGPSEMCSSPISYCSQGSGCSGWPTWGQVSCSVFMSGESSDSFCHSNDQVKQFPIETGGHCYP